MKNITEVALFSCQNVFRVAKQKPVNDISRSQSYVITLNDI